MSEAAIAAAFLLSASGCTQVRPAAAEDFALASRVHHADEIMAEILAKRFAERAGFVVMKRRRGSRPPLGGGFERK